MPRLMSLIQDIQGGVVDVEVCLDAKERAVDQEERSARVA
jgi:hypothetical protein